MTPRSERVAISNLAWDLDEDPEIRQALHSLGVRGVEIAPSKIWEHPLAVSPDEVKQYREYWAEADIAIVSLQSLCFGRPDLQLFESETQRSALLDHLVGMCELAVALGAEHLVYGSPKQRVRGDLRLADAESIAVDFFASLGERAESLGVIVCFEPNAA
ncbi:MAG: TIM barrel protein, partial [Bdellovibrionales bacterium]|nr:TIM barrel protein [Bdellovibrionales bacterium]